MALAILSGMSASEFALCVHNNDVATLVKLPGVGKKTAERLLIEMRDRVGDLEAGSVDADLQSQEDSHELWTLF